MCMTLEGKVALIAGASRGIGADISRYLAAAGVKVAVAARSVEQKDPRLPGTIHSVVSNIESAGGEAFPVVVNMRDSNSIRECVANVVEKYGQINILVNNAAIFVPGDIETVQERHLELSIDVNFRSYILSMREVIPHMRAAGGGHIINVSSRGAIPLGPGPYSEDQQNRAGDIFYGAEKIGLEHFSQRQAAMLQKDNIAVNILSPEGRISTPGNLYAANDRDNPNLDFETADDMGQSAVWICQQLPQEFTGNVVFDKDLLTEKGIALLGPFH